MFGSEATPEEKERILTFLKRAAKRMSAAAVTSKSYEDMKGDAHARASFALDVHAPTTDASHDAWHSAAAYEASEAFSSAPAYTKTESIDAQSYSSRAIEEELVVELLDHGGDLELRKLVRDGMSKEKFIQHHIELSRRRGRERLRIPFPLLKLSSHGKEIDAVHTQLTQNPPEQYRKAVNRFFEYQIQKNISSSRYRVEAFLDMISRSAPQQEG